MPWRVRRDFSVIETFKVGLQKKIILPDKEKVGGGDRRIFFVKGVIRALSVLGSPFCDKK